MIFEDLDIGDEFYWTDRPHPPRLVKVAVDGYDRADGGGIRCWAGPSMREQPVERAR